MEPISIVKVAEVIGAGNIVASEASATGICTDTRSIQPGDLFFALVGENSDGHDYVEKALIGGASAAVVSRRIENLAGIQLVVADPLRALGDLASYYRSQFSIPVIGVTGSVGKTSTKDMLAAALGTSFKTLVNQKNFNNEIGVPLTLFNLNQDHEAVVVEMGMRALGEIDRLAEIALPDIGLITNIGYAHIEILGSRENIAQAKSELFNRIPAGGTAILPRHDDWFPYLLERVPKCCKIITFTDSANLPADVIVLAEKKQVQGDSYNYVPPTYHLETGQNQNTISMRQVSIYCQPYSANIRGKVYKGELSVAGKHHLRNAAAVLSIALALDMPIENAIEGLRQWQGAPGRMQEIQGLQGVLVLDDCYNAGPESMEAALSVLTMRSSSIEEMSKKPCTRVAVLGDMRELGDFAIEIHRHVGRKVVEYGVQLLITVGDLAQEIASESERFALELGKQPAPRNHFMDSESAADGIWSLVERGDCVLVKGSRAMEMEKITASLTGRERQHG